MDNFLVRETSGSTSELSIKENDSKFSPQKEASTSVEIKEACFMGKTALSFSDTNGHEIPSTSTLKQVSKGRKLFFMCIFLF